jgi:UDP-N-acetylglucosamine--N-acetylmuramyl-(pentapeptide) pyrophosphoryl-undecaprenol N-acetylglucosamine transferase
VPNLAIIAALKGKEKNVELLYIGSKSPLERELIKDIEFKSITCGKLRRYFSFENIKDAFKIPVGVFQAFKILRAFKPKTVFSKGGYVALPVVIAAWFLKIPVICHESDISPGLTTKISAKIAKKVCLGFEESKKYFPKKGVYTGSPIRKEILTGKKKVGLDFLGFKGKKKIMLIMGGSQGATTINEFIDKYLKELSLDYDIVHIRGAGKLKKSKAKNTSYRQFEYLKDELKDVYACSDIVISRAGANSITELRALKKPIVLVPLGKASSRGDQIKNAKAFKESYGVPVLEEPLNYNDFCDSLDAAKNIKFKLNEKTAEQEIVKIILENAKKEI